MYDDELQVVYDLCYDTINKNKLANFTILEERLKELIPFDYNVDINGFEIYD